MRGFFSINLDDYQDKLAAVDVPMPPGMQPAKRYHTTLRFFKDIEEAEARRIADDVEMAPFRITGDHVMAYPDLEDPELYALTFRNESALHKLRERLSPPQMEYRPHVTLARKPDLAQRFNTGREPVWPVNPIEFKVDRIHFVRSTLGEGGPFYDDVFEIELRG